MSVEVSPVTSRRDLREFIELPFRLHGTPAGSTPWIPPLRLERHQANAFAVARWLEQRKPATPTAFTAGPQGLSWQSEDIESRVAWRPIERIFLTPEALCFLCGAVTLYVPRRVFRDALELKAFLDKAIPSLGDEARRLTEADPTVQTARSV